MFITRVSNVDDSEVERLASQVRELQQALDDAMQAIGRALGAASADGPAAGMLVIKEYRKSIALED